MPEMTTKTTSTRVPCALGNCLLADGQPNSFNELSHHQCQIAFQHWVAYDRNTSPVVCDEERLMCPLLWCRDNFNDLSSCLQHLLTCPWLTDSWYWCPFCHRPERFRAGEAKHNDSPALGKASRLKRAVSFFKHFGRRSSKRVEVSVFDLESCTPPDYSKPELPTSESTSMSSRVHGHSGQEKRYINQGTAQELYEKGTDSNVYHGHSKMPVLDPVQICGTPVSELPAAEFLEFSSSSIAFHESTRNIHDDKSVLSPMPPLHSVPNTLSNTADLTQPTSNILPVQQIVCNPSLMTNTLAIAVNAGSMPAVCPQTRVFDPRGTGHGQEVFSPEGDISDLMVPFACFNNSINDCGLTTTASSVEDLSGIVRALHGEWMQRLAAHIGDSTIGAKLSQQSPFETGIRVLQKYWNRGDLPKVFGDAFALIEIAFACAWMYHRDDRHGYWRYFFEDILKLPYVLLTNEDKILFRKTADLIWCPPRYMSAEALYPSGLIGPCWRQPSTSFELEGNVPIQAPCTRMLPTQGLYTPSSQSSVRPTDLTFRNNEVIRVCARYLDEIEFFGLCERNAVRLQQLSWDDKAPSENLQMITTHVIDPLMRWEGVNDFRDQIINSKDFLHRGLLRNPRELELKLAFDGRLSHPSATSYNEYRTRVASYCDDVMLQSNSSWRHYYYYKDLDTVLAIFHKQQIKINTGYSRVNPRPRLSIAPTLGIQQPLQHQSPLSARSDGSSYSTSSFFTVSTPSTFPGSSGSPSDEYNVITATDIYPSYSPVELPAPDSSLDLPPATAKDTLLRCDDCNTSFSGNIRNRIRNLRRHMETQHDKRSRHSCPELDCDKNYSRRDNLNAHRQRAHRQRAHRVS